MNPALTVGDKLYNPGKKGLKFLIVTGSSGGHIFPALSFLDALKDKYREIDALLVIPTKDKRTRISVKGYKVKYPLASSVELRFNFKNFIAIFGLLRYSLESLILLCKFKPHMVVGFGTLNSVPFVFFAWLLKIKTLIHEQNVIPGRATRLLTKFCDRVAISFIETKEYLKIRPERIVFTGNPLRRELKKVDRYAALNFFGFADDKITLLVMGGSHGSHRINLAFLNALSILPDREALQIIHLSGDKDYEELRQGYATLKIKVKLFIFFAQMQYAYSACDLVVCRAGATTITEIIHFGIPAIIIPYPFAYGHQMANAKVIGDIGSAVIIRDSELDTGRLTEALNNLIHNPQRINAMRAYYTNSARPYANTLLASEAWELLLINSGSI